MDNLADKIAANIVTTLQGVKVSSGYRVTLRNVVRPTTRPVTLAHLDAVVALEGMSRDTLADPTLGIHWVLEWSVYIHVVTSDSARSGPPANVESLKFEAAFDAMQALEADVTRGGFARDTQVDSVTPVDDAESGLDGVLLSGRCFFVAGRSNPYSQLTP